MSSKVYLLSIVFAYEGNPRGFRLTNYLIFLFFGVILRFPPNHLDLAKF